MVGLVPVVVWFGFPSLKKQKQGGAPSYATMAAGLTVRAILGGWRLPYSEYGQLQLSRDRTFPERLLPDLPTPAVLYGQPLEEAGLSTTFPRASCLPFLESLWPALLVLTHNGLCTHVACT